MIHWQVHYFSELPSTNRSLLLEAKTADCSEGCVYVSDFQSKGAGLGANVWHAEPGKNLLASFLLKPALKPVEQFMLSKVVCLSLLDVLCRYVADVTIKWPNDIWIGKRKVAGVLIENSLLGAHLQYSVVGIGLNVNQCTFPDEIPNPVSLASILGFSLDVHALLDEVLHAFSLRYDQLYSTDFQTLNNNYLRCLYQYRAWAFYQSGQQVFRAMIVGVDEIGRLKVVLSDGTQRSFFLKEIVYL